MTQLALDEGLILLMELHCRSMRQEHGHLRIDKLAQDQPIPFPYRQMPTFFVLQIAEMKSLKLWFQIEKTLFDHHEVPLPIPTYMGVSPRLPGRSSLHSQMIAGLLASVIPPAAPRGDTPIRSDITFDWATPRRQPSNVGKSRPASILDIGFLSDRWTPRCFDMMRMVDDDDPPEAEHTTDYHLPRGWKRIPKQVRNPTHPSERLLALLKRSA